MRLRSLVIAGALLAPLSAPMSALAQTWTNYDYPDAGFAVHFPAAPTVATSTYKTAAGVTVPATTWSARHENVVYTVTTADFSKNKVEPEKAIGDAVKTFNAEGEIKLDVDARISQRYGHELSVAGKDGSWSTVAIFFFNDKLYQLHGKAAPPDPTARSSRLIRFQQSLQFPG